MDTRGIIFVIVATMCAIAIILTLAIVLSADFRKDASGVAVLAGVIVTALTSIASAILGIGSLRKNGNGG